MLVPNQLLNHRYRIVEKCGKGGMGTVYKAEDERLAMTVAIKECAFDRPDLRRLFTQEARLVARLRHRAIARVIDHFEEGDCQYFVMDFVAGDTLAEAPPVTLTLPRILAWGDALLDALDFLHSQEPPVVHRDIKPQNIKLWADDSPVLLDFGLAKGGAPVAHTIPSRSVVGYTPHYASIEQMQGGGTEARSDLYSFSATMYRLLTGTVPPDAMTRVEATNDGRPDPLRPILELAPHVSAPLAEIVQKGMATGKSGRFPSAREMRTAWAACRTLHGASTIVHATAVVPTPSARRPESSDAETVRGGATPQAPVAPAQAPAPAPAPDAPAPAPAGSKTVASRSSSGTWTRVVAVAFALLAVGVLAYSGPAWMGAGPWHSVSPEPASEPVPTVREPEPARESSSPPKADSGPVREAAPGPNPAPPPPAVAAGAAAGRTGRIVAWESSPSDLVAGESAVLRWRVEGAPDLEITPGIGPVDARSGSLKVTPTETTTYRLRSPSQPNLEPLGITVSVAEPPRTLAGYDKRWDLRGLVPVGNDLLAIALEAHGTAHHLGQVMVVPIRNLAATPRVLTTWRGDLFGGMSAGPGDRLVTSGHIFSAADGRVIGPFEGSGDGLYFTADGRFAVGRGVAKRDDKFVPVVEVRDGQNGRWLVRAFVDQPVVDFAVSPNGKQIAAVIGDGNTRSVVILDTESGKHMKVLDYWPNAVEWIENGGALAIGEPGRPLAIVDASTWTEKTRLGFMWPLAASPDGRWLAGFNMPGDRTIVRDTMNGTAHTIPGRLAPLAFSADGRLVVISQPQGIAVYNTADGSRVSAIP